MAPLPLPENRRPTPAGYVAACLSKSFDLNVRTEWKSSTPQTVGVAYRLLVEFSDEYTSTLVGWIQRRRKPKFNPGMYNTIRALSKHTLSLEDQTDDPDFAATVRQEIGEVWDDLDGRIEVLSREPPFQPFGEEEAIVLAMAQWFKHDFMTWVDPIKCPKCQGETKFSGIVQSNMEEERMGGARVESHRCANCQAERRFMRSNNPRVLLKTREGRCGEFAQLFYVLLQARSIRSRYVWNSEDHVWCEYWSPTLKHWVHVDSCEAEINKPLLYDQGWGKKQAFCLSFGQDGASDVSQAYISDWTGDCQRRRAARGWNDIELRKLLLEVTLELRNRVTSDERDKLGDMDEQQSRWVYSTRRKLELERELPGRDSGTQDWKEARGETGKE